VKLWRRHEVLTIRIMMDLLYVVILGIVNIDVLSLSCNLKLTYVNFLKVLNNTNRNTY